MGDLLYTLAYPTLNDADRDWIEAFRRAHDLPFHDVVKAHVTLAFGYAKLDRAAYIAHVAEIAAISAPIEFHCRYAMQGVDDSDDTGYVFLVPDEGYSDIALLHDRLYTGALTPALRLDIPFTPHMTIGTLPNHREARRLCDTLNAEGVSVMGRIERLTVSVLRDGQVTDIAEIGIGV